MIDWDKVWEDHDVWFLKESESFRCSHCNANHSTVPDWEDQKEKISQLAEQQLWDYKS